MNWLERARLEIQESAGRTTDVTDDRNLTAVMAVPGTAVCEESQPPLAAVTYRAPRANTQHLDLLTEIEGRLRGAERDSPPLKDVTRERWALFLDDGIRFSAEWGVVAPSLGWDALSLFGCSVVKPLARIDRQGLIWALRGDRVTMLTADVAFIAVRPGVNHTFARPHPLADGMRLPWG